MTDSKWAVLGQRRCILNIELLYRKPDAAVICRHVLSGFEILLPSGDLDRVATGRALDTHCDGGRKVLETVRINSFKLDTPRINLLEAFRRKSNVIVPR